MQKWFMAFLSVVSWQFHPGSGRGDSRRLSNEECYLLAGELMEYYEKKREDVCRG